MYPTRKTLARWLSAVAFCAAVAPAAPAADPEDKSNSPPNVLDGQALVQALQAGGHVIYFRHGKTDLKTQDTDRKDLSNCATQRQLTAEGHREMQDIGRSFEALNIRVGTVLSSPYCRAIDTARLAFGRVTIDPDLTHTVTADEATTRRQAAALSRLIATVPAAGSNTVLAGHTGNLQEATGIWPSPEAVAIVFKPDGKGSYRYIATVPPERWAQFRRAYSGSRQ
jgi:phosphohistidine phosphatase SixA